MSSFAATALAFAMLLCGLAVPALADVIERLDVTKLEARAEAVVRARVLDVVSEWNANRSFIFTHATLEVLEAYKGTPPSVLKVRVPGGVVGSYRISAESMPEFHAGEEVVVFLTRWGDGAYKVAGYYQGLSTVVQSPEGRRLRRGALDRQTLRDAEPKLRRLPRPE